MEPLTLYIYNLSRFTGLDSLSPIYQALSDGKIEDLHAKSPLGMILGMFRPQIISRNFLGMLAARDLKRTWEPSNREL